MLKIELQYPGGYSEQYKATEGTVFWPDLMLTITEDGTISLHSKEGEFLNAVNIRQLLPRRGRTNNVRKDTLGPSISAAKLAEEFNSGKIGYNQWRKLVKIYNNFCEALNEIVSSNMRISHKKIFKSILFDSKKARIEELNMDPSLKELMKDVLHREASRKMDEIGC